MKICIIGGTGSVAQALIKKINCKDAIIYSRDEYSQNIMKRYYKAEYKLGDIRNYERTEDVIKQCNIVYHLAALKYVCTGEEQPMESVYTNIIGTNNIVKICENYNIKLIYLSTDKSVYPVNVYGCTKFISEKVVKNSKCDYVIIRSGNVWGSRGSLIPLIEDMKKEKKKVHLTDERMERYFISKDDIVKELIKAQKESRKIIIPKMKLFKIIDIIKKYNCEYEIIGKREGEKLKENLFWENEK